MSRFLLLLSIGIMVGAVTAESSEKGPGGAQDPKAVRATQSNPAASKPDEKKEDCGCETKVPSNVLAIVDGVNIEIKDVDELVKERVQPLQNQVIEARRRQLDVEINARLLTAEASRLGIATETLLEREVAQKVKQPTDADAQAFYDQNKSRIQGEFKDLRGQIISYIRSQW